MAKKNGNGRGRYQTKPFQSAQTGSQGGSSSQTGSNQIMLFNANGWGLANPGQNRPDQRLTYDANEVARDADVAGNHTFPTGYRIKFDGEFHSVTVLTGHQITCTRVTTVTTKSGFMKKTIITLVVMMKQFPDGHVVEERESLTVFSEQLDELQPVSELFATTTKTFTETFTKAQRDEVAEGQLKPVLGMWKEASQDVVTLVRANAQGLDKYNRVQYKALGIMKVFPDEDVPFAHFLGALSPANEPYYTIKRQYAKSRERIMFRDEMARIRPELARELAINKRLVDRPYHGPYSMTHPPDHAKLNEGNANANNGLMKLLTGAPELVDCFLQFLPCYRDQVSLAQTCRLGLAGMQVARCHWNASQGDFQTEGVGSHGSSTLTVSRTNSNGFRFSKNERFWEELASQCNMLNALAAVGDKLKVLHLQGLNLLTPGLVEQIVLGMPRLEHLGVHQCLQLGFFQTTTLLEAVKRVQDHRMEDRIAPLEFDFAPMYFDGANTCVRVGSWGVFFNEPCFSIEMPIVATLVHLIWPAARAVAMNPFEKGSSFRHYLDRLPIDPALITKVYAAVTWREKQTLVANVGLGQQARGARISRIEEAFEDLITAAIFGDGAEPCMVPKSTFVPMVNRNEQDTAFQHKVPDQLQRLWQWWRRERSCAHCKLDLKAWAFFFGASVCGICMAMEHCDDHEDSHYRKYYKKLGDELSKATSSEGMALVKGPVNSKGRLEWGWKAMEKAYDFERRYDFHPDELIEFEQETGARHPGEECITHRMRLMHQFSGPVNRKLKDVQYLHPFRFPNTISPTADSTVAFGGGDGRPRYGVRHGNERAQLNIDYAKLRAMYHQAEVANKAPNAPCFTTDGDWRRQHVLSASLPMLRGRLDSFISRRQRDRALSIKRDWAIGEDRFFALLGVARMRGETDAAFITRITTRKKGEKNDKAFLGRLMAQAGLAKDAPIPQQNQTELAKLVGLENGCPYPLPAGVEWVYLLEKWEDHTQCW